MFLNTLLNQVRAAHALASAIDSGRAPAKRDLKTLGLTENMASNFKR